MIARVRPARPADKRPLMSFIKDNWGGHDYIPRMWDEWLKDKTGKVFIVEADGVPVGMNKGQVPRRWVCLSRRCQGPSQVQGPRARDDAGREGHALRHGPGSESLPSGQQVNEQDCA